MNASKENARQTLGLLEQLAEEYKFSGDDRYEGIKEFLEAALRKLPTEASYQRDKGK